MTKIKMDSELDAPFDTEILKLEFWEYMNWPHFLAYKKQPERKNNNKLL